MSNVLYLVSYQYSSSQVTLSLWSIILCIKRSGFGYIQPLNVTKLKGNVATIDNNNIVILTTPSPLLNEKGSMLSTERDVISWIVKPERVGFV